jgi:hypothetical protein
MPFRKGWHDFGMPIGIPVCGAREASKTICQEAIRLLNITK